MTTTNGAQKKTRQTNYTSPPANTARRACWTPERRARQAALIRARRPWLASTGPRTAAGKRVSARNAFKGGERGRLRELARLGRAFLDTSATIVRTVAAALTLQRTADAHSDRVHTAPDEQGAVPARRQGHPGWSLSGLDSIIKENNLLLWKILMTPSTLPSASASKPCEAGRA